MLMVEVVDKGPFFPVGEEYPYHAEPSRKAGMLLLDHLSQAPDGMATVFNLVSQSEIEPFSHVLFYNKKL